MGLDHVFSSRVACDLPYCNVDPTSVCLLFISIVCTKVFFALRNVQSSFWNYLFRHVFDLNEHMISLTFPIEVTPNDV